MTERTIGVGVIGLGFMGRTHIAAYRRADDAGFANRLVAVSDHHESRRRGELDAEGNLGSTGGTLFDPTDVRAYDDPMQLLRDPNVDLVSICTPTDSHVDLAIAALTAGKHVLLEKPVALAAHEVARLAAIANDAPTRCMPAMCMRFWPAWAWLKDRVVDGSLGSVRSATFRRLGTRPSWGGDFYLDPRRSGGALIDLHIHDADFVRYLFGSPDRVVATGDRDHVSTFYQYDRGPVHVVAEGGWDHAAGFPFQMRYVVVFDDATVEFDLSRDPQLRLHRDGTSTPVELADTDGYDGEVRHLLGAIADPTLPLSATLDDAVELARMLEEESRQVAR